MSELRKLSYNPDEVDSSEEEVRSASDETGTGSSGTEDTASDDSQDTGTDEELEMRKSPNPPAKLYSTSIPGTPGLSLHPIEIPVNEGSGQEEESTEQVVQVKNVPEVSAIPQKASADSITETPTLKVENAKTGEIAKKLLPEERIQTAQEVPEGPKTIRKGSIQSQSQRYKTAKRVMELPLVKSALDAFNVVEQIPLLGWFAYCTRMQCNASVTCLNVIVSPCLNRCGPLVSNIDNALGIVLDVAEKVLPCLKMTPQQMLGSTARCTVDCVCYVPRSVCCLAGPCRPKAKEQ